MKLYFTHNFAGCKYPVYAHKFDSGMDVFAAEDIILKPGERKTIQTGIQFEITLPLIYKILNLFGASIGVELQVRPKSGLSKAGIDVELGTIDFLYRGIVGVTITNTTKDIYVFSKNDKICQIVVCPVFNRVNLIYKKSIPTNTSRGTGGFGSTGK